METAMVAKNTKLRQGSRLVTALIYVAVGAAACITLYPFLFIASNSISSPMESAANTVWLLPKGLSIKAYRQIFTSPTILRAFVNSVFFAAVLTLLNVSNSIVAGYALSRSRLLGRKLIVIYIIVPMFFHAGLIPTFIVVSLLGVYNTMLAIILPGIVGIWNIILARTYISRLPAALREAAIIDGAGDLQIIGRIMVPLCTPIIAVLSLYTALAAWNAWFNYLIYLPSHEEWHPLQLYLTKCLIWGNMNNVLIPDPSADPELIQNKLLMAAVGSQIKYAVIMVAALPMILLYPFVQKYFIRGIMLGSLKE